MSPSRIVLLKTTFGENGKMLSIFIDNNHLITHCWQHCIDEFVICDEK